jgi:hypothetical protein
MGLDPKPTIRTARTPSPRSAGIGVALRIDVTNNEPNRMNTRRRPLPSAAGEPGSGNHETS